MRHQINGFEYIYHPPTGFFKMRRLSYPFDVHRDFIAPDTDINSYAFQRTAVLSM